MTFKPDNWRKTLLIWRPYAVLFEADSRVLPATLLPSFNHSCTLPLPLQCRFHATLLALFSHEDIVLSQARKPGHLAAAKAGLAQILFVLNAVDAAASRDVSGASGLVRFVVHAMPLTAGLRLYPV